MITLTHYLILSAILFSIALVGILRRKNLLMLFFATEIALNAVNIALAAFSKYYGDLTGQLFAFFIIAIAASEVAVGLGLLIIWYKRRGTIDLDSLQSMNG
ncbi:MULTISPECIES: NADH-quinone oxidoreductase subunit NuoK [unclassified Nitratiruptor]|uniref:NADH-quinone oxidoreductase subunit K n=1 Tax=Nitratiruptor sp. (strain SB155-2) TaxID=387092 RepID=NUOK_NITSB|nr:MULTISPECIES: NADH-quinone oxidoreductase subunit NuoK [unclassified Nitratiruptor]A6Q1Q4.1 RecName: Full=NADH-quinone oxidoreductase subunit K; AltName: Full=NADH dehydrogenase I subunit K; AltName: Full=NDH-1 subunit K [Nitratiruptor sp. SB155-2]BAF69413.1 NADH-quinone oxidoreductase, chain K [Nitratiruptor sp. SB155-2]BCD59567.1 NADH-quinone oxidoreductase subunit K [Nitratiruptor sp. YY08-10]BCD63491.1 NADH-quinone oxidoreductase subunit K [Nitratiruptor sp. YY08-14]